MNPGLERLTAYPFERLAQLLRDTRPPAALAHIAMSIGEPRHPPPPFVLDTLRANLHQLGSYPATKGLPALRASIAAHLSRQALSAGTAVGDAATAATAATAAAAVAVAVAVDPDTMVLPVNGTREALFSFVQAMVDLRGKQAAGAGRPGGGALVAMPNPCYQIYEGAALLAGAEPYYLDTTAATGLVPDLEAVPPAIWERCQLLFLCSPGNPTGAVLSLAYLKRALELAERHDFVIAADECYADLYLDEARPPPSLLLAARQGGRTRFERCMIFRSLSKRSSVPGLRSGFVAGDPRLMQQYLLYRTYHGCAMPVPTQLASIAAWDDEAHVIANRALYREKFQRVLPILAPCLDVARPEGGFYLWPDIGRAWSGGADDAEFTRALHAQQNVTILPGSYLARDNAGGNPGRGRVRISLVADVADCVEAARRIETFLA
jgi:N-succinyldiaminopimelate aminotransferase